MSQQSYESRIRLLSQIDRDRKNNSDWRSVNEIMPFLQEGFINISNPDEAVSNIANRVLAGDGFSFFTMNLDHLCKLKRFKSFRRLYSKATFVSADGWPVAFLAGKGERPIVRTTGADLIFPVCELAARSNFDVFLFGSSQEVLDHSSKMLSARYAGLNIVGKISPPPRFDPQSDFARQSAEAIAASGAHLCFVALGAPTQEAFSEFAKDFAPQTGFLCVGAALDFIAGTQRRAPLILRRLGLEWAWRCALSPRRLARRYMQCIVVLTEIVLFRLRHWQLNTQN